MVSRVIRLPLVVFLLSLGFFTGCIFSPEKKAPKLRIPPKYFAPTSPDHVLQNLILAYMDRDSLATGNVYDLNYQGFGAADPNELEPLPEFTRDIEIRHVGRLKLDPNIVSVFLDLGPPAAWQILDGNASDPPGWKIINITSQTVRIEDIGRLTTWESRNHVIEYAFKPTAVPGAPADEDTTWQIARWTEL